MTVYHIASAWSPTPRGRNERDLVGSKHGEAFRKTVLLDLLQGDRVITFDFDGTTYVGPSFIDEAFGGLIRKERLAPQYVRDHVKVASRRDPTIVTEFNRALTDAEREAGA